MASLGAIHNILQAVTDPNNLLRVGGRVTSITPGMLTAKGLANRVRLGELVTIGGSSLGEVVRVEGDTTLVCPFDCELPIRLGDHVLIDRSSQPHPTDDWLGRVLDATGKPTDGCPAPISSFGASTKKLSDSAMARDRVQEPLKTGVKIIDIFTPLCKGQRMGIFAGSGVGKSTLLSMLAKSDAFDAVVVAMVGERGREVREFLDDSIGSEAMKKTVAIVATSDESAMLRRRAPELAMEVCEYLCQSGKSVLLLIDSLTRYAHALREIGVAVGEPPIARGYPASVFSQLPKLLERAGTGSSGSGSITAITTVLVDGDDHNDPVSDAVRGIIDGHLVLDRAIAEEGRYPPINPLSSISRLSSKAWSEEERDLVLQLKKMISRFEESRDLRMLGGWQSGNDPQLDKAIETVPVLYEALCQAPNAPLSSNAFSDLVSYLKRGASRETSDGQD